jgi:hypothetical protein
MGRKYPAIETMRAKRSLLLKDPGKLADMVVGLRHPGMRKEADDTIGMSIRNIGCLLHLRPKIIKSILKDKEQGLILLKEQAHLDFCAEVPNAD